MIILAAAIILSLSNSGIIGKANKAKTDSDTANLKEYVNTLRAEWELMTAEEQTAAGSFVDYANSKLAEKGYKRELAADGETVMNENATAAVKAGIKVGCEVEGYNDLLDEKEYPIKAGVVDATDEQTLKTNSKYKWYYIGIGEDGNLLIAPKISGTLAAEDKMTLKGVKGYLNGEEELNNACRVLYSVEGKGTARSMNIDDVNSILGYTGEKGQYYDETDNLLTIGQTGQVKELGTNTRTPEKPTNGTVEDISKYKLDFYSISKSRTDIINKELVFASSDTCAYWLASTCVGAYFNLGYAFFSMRGVNSISVNSYSLFYSQNSSRTMSCAVRPVVALNSNMKLTPNADKTVWAIN